MTTRQVWDVCLRCGGSLVRLKKGGGLEFGGTLLFVVTRIFSLFVPVKSSDLEKS